MIIMSTRGHSSPLLSKDLADSARTGALHPDFFQSTRSCTRTSGPFLSMPVHLSHVPLLAPRPLHDRDLGLATALTALVGAKRGIEPCEHK